MSIRPIDLQNIVQKGSELNRLTNNDSHKTDASQHHFAQHLQKEVQHEDQSVKSSNKSEKQEINKDGRGNKGESSKQNKKNARKDEKEAPKVAESSSMLDITI